MSKTIQKIAILVPRFHSAISQYGVLFHFSKKIHEAFTSIGMHSRILDSNSPTLLSDLLADPPDCTFAFNGLRADLDGQFFCDKIKIPHVSFLLDSPHKFLLMKDTRYAVMTCVDRFAVDFLQRFGFPRVLFMPHAVESTLEADPAADRIYDLVLIASFLDPEEIYNEWTKKFSPRLCKTMKQSAELTLLDPILPFYVIFEGLLDPQTKEELQHPLKLIDAFDQIENYMRAKERIDLILAIKNANVDLFGASQGKTGWNKYVADRPNIRVHKEVPFDQALEIMKQSKIVLNSCSSFKQGAHERIFAGLACGALALTNENIYMHEQFKEGESIAFFRYPNLDALDQTIEYYLNNEKTRQEVAKQGREIVMHSHTWQKRAEQLIQQLPHLIESIDAK